MANYKAYTAPYIARILNSWLFDSCPLLLGSWLVEVRALWALLSFPFLWLSRIPSSTIVHSIGSSNVIPSYDITALRGQFPSLSSEPYVY